MNGIVLLLAVLAGAAILAAFVAFAVLSAVASLVEILPPRFARHADDEDRDGQQTAGGWLGERLNETVARPAAALRGARRAL